MRIIILEGARGSGKSTIANMMRQRMSETTLINPTGFHTDGDEGLEEIKQYYDAWYSMLENLPKHDSIYVFDRFYFSEMVFSSLYKSYDFREKYLNLLDSLDKFSGAETKVDVFYFVINNPKELKNRLHRDKIGFADVEESVGKSMEQQDRYSMLFKHFKNYTNDNDNLNLHILNTRDKNRDEIFYEVKHRISV